MRLIPMKNTNTTTALPSIDAFKAQAKALKEKDAQLKHTHALEQVSQQYGYRNYNSIKPFLREAIFPITMEDVKLHSEKHLKYNALLQAGQPDFFLLSGHRLLMDAVKNIDKLPYVKKGMLLKNEGDVWALLSFLKIDIAMPFAVELARAKVISLYDLEASNILEKYAFGRISDECVYNDPNPPVASGKIKSVTELAVYLKNLWKTASYEEKPFLSLDLDIQQFSYREQSLYFIFNELNNGNLGKTYPVDLKEISELDRAETEGWVKMYIDSYKSISSMIKFHDTKESFMEDLTRNLPLEERTPMIHLFDREDLEVIYDRWVELQIPFALIQRERTKESVETFSSFLEDMLIRELEEEAKEVIDYTL